MKTFKVISFISLVLTLSAAALSIIGMPVTGFYPAIIMLLFVALIPLATRFYSKRNFGKLNNSGKNYYSIFTIINLLIILVVLWMAFVIIHDRVLKDCC